VASMTAPSGWPSRASSAASHPPMRGPSHASRFEGIAKMKLQASRASDRETLQSQVTKDAKKGLSLRGLKVRHGRLHNDRGDRGNVSMILSPVPASILPDSH